jgi:CheY-like chemotaxis protein
MNLLSNAIKFTKEGKITVRIGVERETETHTLIRFAVTDTGEGVPEAARARLFQSFSQADASTTREHGGIGVGLAISRQLVELMGGVISFDSKQGEGSTFWFTVPFEKRVSERLAVAGAKQAFPGARVLILDESETNRKLLQHYLTSWGMRSRFADTAEQTMDRLRAEAELGDPYQVLLFDRHARGIDAIKFAQAIRAEAGLSATGVVMLTHLGEQIDDGQARRAGIAAYLAKPVDRSELFDCLTVAMAAELRHRSELAEQYVSSPLAAVTVGEVPKETRERTRILLAEDKPLNQKLTLSQLRSLGYSADAVSNGTEVIDALRQKEYDVILMDCQMPLMDGYETTIEIRRQQQGNGKRTRIIAMTANAMEGDREKCLAAGMDDYLPKPTKREELEKALARAIVPPQISAS